MLVNYKKNNEHRYEVTKKHHYEQRQPKTGPRQLSLEDGNNCMFCCIALRNFNIVSVLSKLAKCLLCNL